MENLGPLLEFSQTNLPRGPNGPATQPNPLNGFGSDPQFSIFEDFSSHEILNCQLGLLMISPATHLSANKQNLIYSFCSRLKPHLQSICENYGMEAYIEAIRNCVAGGNLCQRLFKSCKKKRNQKNRLCRKQKLDSWQGPGKNRNGRDCSRTLIVKVIQ